jgi:protein-disulfide isomerase
MRKFLGAAILVFSVAAIAFGGSARAASSLDEAETSAVQKLIHDYILEHPEVIVESMQNLQARQQKEDEQRRRQAAGAVSPIKPTDHILGDPNAAVKVIEFSDFECPFCKGFHETLTKLMSDYGKKQDVAWVYRHFPIDELHSKARKEAQAAECAAEQGGNDAFWAYADKIFATTPSNNRLDLALLPKFAVEIGLDQAKFETCLKGDARGGKFAEHIEADFQDASQAGGSGTPYTVVLGPDGSTFPINGALPYSSVKSIIDLALEKK